MSHTVENQEKFLEQLRRLDDHAIDSLLKKCFDLLKNGPQDNGKTTSADENQEFIHNLLLFTTRILKHEYSNVDLKEQLNSMDCNNHYFQEKYPEWFRLNRDCLQSILTSTTATNSFDKYVHLKWRFEVKLSGKYFRERFQPQIVLSFCTRNSNRKNGYKHIDIKCTVADIYHIYRKLSEMIESNNSLHSAKLLKNINPKI